MTESFGWSAIFLINVPVGAIGLACGRSILADREPVHRPRFDLAGMLIQAGALFALLFALTEGMSYGWGSPLVLGSFAAAAAGLALFVRLEQTRAAPLLELDLFRSRSLSGANAVSLLSTAVMCAIFFFFISLYLQAVRGYTAIGAGAVFLPMTLLICLVAPAAGRLSDRIGRRLPATTGILILAAGLWLLTGLSATGGLGTLLPGLIVAGAGIDLTTAPTTTAALDFAPLEQAGVRAGVLNTSRMIGLAIGIALMGAIVTARWPGGFAGAATDPGAFVDGLSVAFGVNAAIALAAAALAALTIANGPAAARRP